MYSDPRGSGSFYTVLGIFTIYSKNVVGQCVLTIPTITVGTWFTGGQYWKKQVTSTNRSLTLKLKGCIMYWMFLNFINS